jgi:CMP-N-acetylneuraminic acid synthetase
MFLNKKILCLIPARGGSKGIINKNLKKIKNKSLVKISIDFAKSLRYVDKIVVSSDETKILKEAKLSKVNLHKRSKKLSGSLVSDYEIINEIINNFEGFDYLIYLQPTSPFRKKKSITEMFENLIKTKSQGAWSVTAVDKKFHP